MMRFADELSTAAEPGSLNWLMPLARNVLESGPAKACRHPNAYALSNDGGHTWSKAKSTGILGQSTALTPLSDGSAPILVQPAAERPRGGVDGQGKTD